MSWRDIIRKEEKAHCGTEKLDDEELKAAKPDFLDLDGDGNKTEPMKEAAKNKKHDDSEKKAKMKCPKCKGKGCAHCKGTGYHEVKSKNPFTRKD
jgi:hypothetical protein|tara:strand:- start:609 stop:893 length:285 start_codon:yes stop_codon:yes gene_type:complete